MNIAIIGAGNVGTALGSGWTKAGDQIIWIHLALFRRQGLDFGLPRK